MWKSKDGQIQEVWVVGPLEWEVPESAGIWEALVVFKPWNLELKVFLYALAGEQNYNKEGLFQSLNTLDSPFS